MKLDKSKPYGQVSGEHSAAFEQDGAFFDINGNEIVVEQEDEPQSPGDGGGTQETAATPKVMAVKKSAPSQTPGKKRGPKPAAEEKPASPVDVQIAAQIGA